MEKVSNVKWLFCTYKVLISYILLLYSVLLHSYFCPQSDYSVYNDLRESWCHLILCWCINIFVLFIWLHIPHSLITESLNILCNRLELKTLPIAIYSWVFFHIYSSMLYLCIFVVCMNMFLVLMVKLWACYSGGAC